MAISVVMPALEMAQETGKLVSWKKKEGDAVKKGELLLEVETDKAVVEIEAAGDGILGGVTAQVGAVVPVGQTIAWLLKPGEQPPTSTAAVQTGRTGAAAMQPAVVAPESAAGPQGDALAVATAASVRISPKARRLAKEHGVDVTRIKGTGPGGEIVAEDVLAAKGRAPAPPAAAPRAASTPAASAPTPAAELGALSSIGKIMAERTTASWTTAPHFFVTREVDCTDLVAARRKFGPEIERTRGVKLTFTDLLTAVIAQTLRKHPRMNASWTGDAIKANADVNVGLAMAVTDAVVVGVVPKTDGLTLGDIASRRRDLTERARTNKLSPADITGATFTISNLGMYHVDSFTAIIVPPQAGILAVGAMTDRLVPVMGGIATKPMMTLTLSCDHRVLDGARGAMFMHDLVELLLDATHHVRP
jgi:pyruvate dehydrogenase E2 component (dihydrolipoyllysine-residue acetyltransferase)